MRKTVSALVTIRDADFAGYAVELYDPETQECVHKALIPKGRPGKLSVPVDVPEAPVERSPAVNRSTRRASKKQERRIAEDIGGRAQPASGALPHAKGDVRKQGKLRIEAKMTYAESYRLTRDVLDKIASHATFDEVPVVVVDFVDKRTQRVERSVAVVPYEDWVRISNAADVDS